ncbi:MAG: helix-turn-helix domain-containing protein [Terracoccus sp.]
MTVQFRNIDIDPASPVESWPFEAIATVVDRGTVSDWARLAAAISADPWGPVARQVEELFGYSRPWGVTPLLERAIARARSRADESERAAVSGTVRDLVARSGLSMGAFARRIGTSRTRLSTYRTGSVVPSAALVVRMTNLVERIESADGSLRRGS